MNTNSKDFNELGTKGVGRLLWQYALPAIMAMTASSLYNIVDGIFIGQGVGEAAIMGLALTTPLMSLTAAFGAMVGVGGSTLMSIRLGQRDYRTAKHILGNVVIMNCLIGLSLGLGLQLFLEPILLFFGASSVTLPYAYDFMTIILAGNMVTHLYLGLNALLRSTGRPQMAMYATLGTVLINLILAPIFIFVMDMGIQGAAWATVGAQFLMLCWELTLFAKSDQLVCFSRDIMHLEGKIVKDSLVIGLPQFLVNACACLLAVIVTRSMSSYGGDVAVGAFGISNRLVMFVVLVVIGLNQGMQPIAGFNYGAGRNDRLLSVLKMTIAAATVITLSGFLCAQFFAEACVALFAKDAPELMAESAHGLRVTTLIFPLVGMQIVSTAFFQSIGKAGQSIFLSLTRQLFFLLPGLLIFPYFFERQVDGVWYAMPISDALSSVLSLILLTLQIRKLKTVHPSL